MHETRPPPRQVWVLVAGKCDLVNLMLHVSAEMPKNLPLAMVVVY